MKNSTLSPAFREEFDKLAAEEMQRVQQQRHRIVSLLFAMILLMGWLVTFRWNLSRWGMGYLSFVVAMTWIIQLVLQRSKKTQPKKLLAKLAQEYPNLFQMDHTGRVLKLEPMPRWHELDHQRYLTPRRNWVPLVLILIAAAIGLAFHQYQTQRNSLFENLEINPKNSIFAADESIRVSFWWRGQSPNFFEPEVFFRQTGQKSAQKVKISQDDQQVYTAHLGILADSGEWAIRLGENWSPWFPIELQEMTRHATGYAWIQYPKYLEKLPEKIEIPLQFQIPQGSQIEFQLPISFKHKKLRIERTDSRITLPIEFQLKGKEIHFLQPVYQDVDIQLHYLDQSDIWRTLEIAKIKSVDDRPPVLHNLFGMESCNPVDWAQRTIRFQAKDDHGLGFVYIDYLDSVGNILSIPFSTFDSLTTQFSWNHVPPVPQDFAARDWKGFRLRIEDRRQFTKLQLNPHVVHIPEQGWVWFEAELSEHPLLHPFQKQSHRLFVEYERLQSEIRQFQTNLHNMTQIEDRSKLSKPALVAGELFKKIDQSIELLANSARENSPYLSPYLQKVKQHHRQSQYIDKQLQAMIQSINRQDAKIQLIQIQQDLFNLQSNLDESFNLFQTLQSKQQIREYWHYAIDQYLAFVAEPIQSPNLHQSKLKDLQTAFAQLCTLQPELAEGQKYLKQRISIFKPLQQELQQIQKLLYKNVSTQQEFQHSLLISGQRRLQASIKYFQQYFIDFSNLDLGDIIFPESTVRPIQFVHLNSQLQKWLTLVQQHPQMNPNHSTNRDPKEVIRATAKLQAELRQKIDTNPAIQQITDARKNWLQRQQKIQSLISRWEIYPDEASLALLSQVTKKVEAVILGIPILESTQLVKEMRSIEEGMEHLAIQIPTLERRRVFVRPALTSWKQAWSGWMKWLEDSAFDLTLSVTKLEELRQRFLRLDLPACGTHRQEIIHALQQLNEALESKNRLMLFQQLYRIARETHHLEQICHDKESIISKISAIENDLQSVIDSPNWTNRSGRANRLWKEIPFLESPGLHYWIAQRLQWVEPSGLTQKEIITLRIKLIEAIRDLRLRWQGTNSFQNRWVWLNELFSSFQRFIDSPTLRDNPIDLLETRLRTLRLLAEVDQTPWPIELYDRVFEIRSQLVEAKTWQSIAEAKRKWSLIHQAFRQITIREDWLEKSDQKKSSPQEFVSRFQQLQKDLYWLEQHLSNWSKFQEMPIYYWLNVFSVREDEIPNTLQLYWQQAELKRRIRQKLQHLERLIMELVDSQQQATILLVDQANGRLEIQKISQQLKQLNSQVSQNRSEEILKLISQIHQSYPQNSNFDPTVMESEIIRTLQQLDRDLIRIQKQLEPKQRLLLEQKIRNAAIELNRP